MGGNLIYYAPASHLPPLRVPHVLGVVGVGPILGEKPYRKYDSRTSPGKRIAPADGGKLRYEMDCYSHVYDSNTAPEGKHGNHRDD